MEFAVYRTSSQGINTIRHFNRVDELVNFMEKNQCSIIIGHNPVSKENPEEIAKYNNVSKDLAERLSKIKYAIEIYDDYRE